MRKPKAAVALTPTQVRKLRHTKRDLLKKGLPLPIVEKHITGLERAMLITQSQKLKREKRQKAGEGSGKINSKPRALYHATSGPDRSSISFFSLGSSLNFD